MLGEWLFTGKNLSDEDLAEALAIGELRSAMLTDIEHGRPSAHPDAIKIRGLDRDPLVEMRLKTYRALVEIRAEIERRAHT